MPPNFAHNSVYLPVGQLHWSHKHQRNLHWLSRVLREERGSILRDKSSLIQKRRSVRRNEIVYRNCWEMHRRWGRRITPKMGKAQGNRHGKIEQVANPYNVATCSDVQTMLSYFAWYNFCNIFSLQKHSAHWGVGNIPAHWIFLMCRKCSCTLRWGSVPAHWCVGSVPAHWCVEVFLHTDVWAVFLHTDVWAVFLHTAGVGSVSCTLWCRKSSWCMKYSCTEMFCTLKVIRTR